MPEQQPAVQAEKTVRTFAVRRPTEEDFVAKNIADFRLFSGSITCPRCVSSFQLDTKRSLIVSHQKMADAMDLMGVGSSSSNKQSELTQLEQLKKTKKPTGGAAARPGGLKASGLNRELFSLIAVDGVVAPIAPLGAGFKEKPNLGSNQAVKWQWRKFSNSARKDGLELFHWARADDTATDYPYAKFDKKLTIVQYTDDEYRTHFDDPEWSRRDTDLLFDLCRRFDLKFPVIADRLEGGRSIEDIKARYYSITKKLIELRNDVTDPLVQSEMAKYMFDKDREVERKAQLDRLHRRTPDQVREEQFLLIEARKIEANAKRLVRDRQYVVQLLAAIDTAFNPYRGRGGPGAPGDQAGVKRRRGLKGGEENDAEASSAIDITFASGVSNLIKKKEKIPGGAYVRSSKAVTPISTSVKMAKRVEQQLEELNIPLQPIVPTAQYCRLFDELRQEILVLLDLKRQCDTREYEIKVLQSRREALLTGKEQPSLPPPPDTGDDDEPTATRKRPIISPDLKDGDLKRARHS